MTSAVLLDALGTLVGFAPPGPSLRAALAERDVHVGRDEADRAVRAEIGYYRANLHRARDQESLAVVRGECAGVIRDALPATTALSDADLGAAVLEAFRFVAFPEVEPELALLRERGIPLVVCSNWDVSLHQVLADVGLAGYLKGVVTSAELGIAKPDPAPFRAALALVGDPAPATALHVGDTVEEDVAGARAAGIRALLVDRDGSAPREGLDDVVVRGSLAGLAHLADGRLASGP